MIFYHFFNSICSFFTFSHCWFVWQEHIHSQCNQRGLLKKRFKFVLFILLTSWLIWGFLRFLYTYFCQHFHFLCVFCVSRKYPYTTQGELMKFPRWGEAENKARSLLGSLNLNWNFQRALRVFFGRSGEVGLKPSYPYGRSTGISGITLNCLTTIHQTIMNLYFIWNTHFRLSNLEELVVNHNELEVTLWFVLNVWRYIEIKKYYIWAY